MLGTFIDTLIVCTMIALVILTSGAWVMTGADGGGLTRAVLTSTGFQTSIPGGQYIVTIVLAVFAFTTRHCGHNGDDAGYPCGRAGVRGAPEPESHDLVANGGLHLPFYVISGFPGGQLGGAFDRSLLRIDFRGDGREYQGHRGVNGLITAGCQHALRPSMPGKTARDPGCV